MLPISPSVRISVWLVGLRSGVVCVSSRPRAGEHPRRFVLYCGRRWRRDADGKSIVMDQSAAWLEPRGVRVRGTTSDFYTSSLLLIILSSSALLLLEAPTLSSLSPPALCTSLCVYLLSVCVYSKQERWFCLLCHGVRWHQVVVDGENKNQQNRYGATKPYSSL